MAHALKTFINVFYVYNILLNIQTILLNKL